MFMLVYLKYFLQSMRRGKKINETFVERFNMILLEQKALGAQYSWAQQALCLFPTALVK
jgi:hypothetical protein